MSQSVSPRWSDKWTKKWKFGKSYCKYVFFSWYNIIVRPWYRVHTDMISPPSDIISLLNVRPPAPSLHCNIWNLSEGGGGIGLHSRPLSLPTCPAIALLLYKYILHFVTNLVCLFNKYIPLFLGEGRNLITNFLLPIHTMIFFYTIFLNFVQIIFKFFHKYHWSRNTQFLWTFIQIHLTFIHKIHFNCFTNTISERIGMELHRCTITPTSCLC